MSEFSLEAFVHSLPAITLYARNDEHYTLKFINAAAASMLGYEPEEFLNNEKYTAATAVHPDDLDLLEKGDETAARTGKILMMRYRLIDAKGREVPVLDTSRPDFDSDGNLQGFISVLIDLRNAPGLQGPSAILTGLE